MIFYEENHTDKNILKEYFSDSSKEQRNLREAKVIVQAIGFVTIHSL